MVWKREIASWREGLADKGKEANGGTYMVTSDKAGVTSLWFSRPLITL
jgi:hypothetical protein